MKKPNYIKDDNALASEDETAEVKALLAQIREQGPPPAPSDRLAVDMAQKQEHGYTGHQVDLFRLIGIRKKK